MKKLIAIIAILLPMLMFAGNYKMKDGKTIVMWENSTPVIEYNSCRVIIQLTDRVDYNVYGTVYLGDKPEPFMIEAGQKSTSVDFDNLSNGKRYTISVDVKEPTSFPSR